jgi:hypothetical protein
MLKKLPLSEEKVVMMWSVERCCWSGEMGAGVGEGGIDVGVGVVVEGGASVVTGLRAGIWVGRVCARRVFKLEFSSRDVVCSSWFLFLNGVSVPHHVKVNPLVEADSLENQHLPDLKASKF